MTFTSVLSRLNQVKKNLAEYYGKRGPKRSMTVPEVMTLNIVRILDRTGDHRITVAPTVETTVNQDIWKAIKDALNKNHILQFDYTDRWGKQTEQRKLRPYQLVLDDGVCYLFGFDELRNAERIFSLVRMRNAVVTDEAFELP